ncbi:MAG: helix-turn-helix domain-containing protein [Spirochaetales bacterium]|nr:helix-turn-helix domain-containing protein [Spirochaetales bacterium]
MSEAFEKIMKGLEEIKAYKEGKVELKTTKVVIEPVPKWEAQKVRTLRQELKLSQSIFGVVLGVSKKTVEAWESGKNIPSGSASRLMEVIANEKDILTRQRILLHS